MTGAPRATPAAAPKSLRGPAYAVLITLAALIAFFVGRWRASGPEPGASEARPGRGVASTAGPEVLFGYRVAHPRWGREELEVGADGTVDYLLEGPERPAVRAVLTLDDERLRALSQRIADAHPCDLRSGRSDGRPNESQPTLQIALPEAHCAVTLWFDEWHELPEARPTMQIVSELRVALAARE